MQRGKRTKNFLKTTHARAIIAGLLMLSTGAPAASLQTFGVLFNQLTNDIATLQQTFDGSPDVRQKLAVFTHARALVLNEDLPDEQALDQLVPLLSPDTNYTASLDASAFNARAAALARYDALGERVAALPPWSRAATARTRFENLADNYSALTNAPHAADISNLLPPFALQLAGVSKYEVRARLMPRPRTRSNSLRAEVNGQRFVSTRSGRNSPNFFEVAAPTDFYREVNARAVDGAGVIHLNLPVLTEQIRYEIASGLAAVSHSPDVFATNVVIFTATNGTFFVQTDRREVYGVFTCDGPGLEIRDGRFRIQLPRALRD